jgi:hypothetical protein
MFTRLELRAPAEAAIEILDLLVAGMYGKVLKIDTPSPFLMSIKMLFAAPATSAVSTLMRIPDTVKGHNARTRALVTEDPLLFENAVVVSDIATPIAIGNDWSILEVPVGPVGPVVPVGPVTLEAAPVAPVGPVGPVTVELAPVAPVGPVGPVAP